MAEVALGIGASHRPMLITPYEALAGLGMAFAAWR